MIVGIPGTGIGGLFYLVRALWLPIRGLRRRRRGQSASSSSGLPQAAMAVGILAGLWLTGELLGLAVAHAFPSTAALDAGTTTHVTNVFRVASLVIGAVTLCMVLTTVQIARVVVRRARAVTRPGTR